MFIGSAQAGDNHAILYTLLENAKRAGLNPREYVIQAINGLNEKILPEELTLLRIASKNNSITELAS